MIDIHSHILPGIDDGASSCEESVAILDAAAAIGYQTIVATPHLTATLTDAYYAKVEAALAALRPMAADRGIELFGGFEVRLTADTASRLRAGEPITLVGGRSVLVDLPADEGAIDLGEVVYNILATGYQPVLAHPERYAMIQKRPRYARELANQGVVLQVTASSFSGLFGRRTRRTAEALVRAGAVHIVATDAHSADHRMAAVAPGLKRLELLVGRRALEQLTIYNPAALLNGEAPTPVHIAPSGIRRLLPAFGESVR